MDQESSAIADDNSKKTRDEPAPRLAGLSTRLLQQGRTAWDSVMAPLGPAGHGSGDGLDDAANWNAAGLQKPYSEEDIADTARGAAPVVWLVGKVQSGKSSIVNALTGTLAGTLSGSSSGPFGGSMDAEIGSGFKACTATASLYDFPLEAPVIRFLDTRGLGEAGYDPSEDIDFCSGRAHLMLVVMKAMDQQQRDVVDVVSAARRRHPDWPIVVAQTSLHEGYAKGQSHPRPYPFARLEKDSAGMPAGFEDLARALNHQCALFEGLAGRGPIVFVALDFTLPGDGLAPQLYGLQALHDALGKAAPKGLAASLMDLARQHGDGLARQAHPHVMGYAAAAAAVDALPVAGLIAVPGVQAKMLHSLARIHGIGWDRLMWIEFCGCLGSGALVRLMAGLGIREAVKLLPVYGQSVATASAAATSFATTVALGKAACYFLELRLIGRSDPEGVKAAYGAALQEAFALAPDENE